MPDADLDTTRLRQRFVDCLFDDVVDRLHGAAATVARPPHQTQRAARPAPPTRGAVVLRHQQPLRPPVAQRVEHGTQPGHPAATGGDRFTQALHEGILLAPLHLLLDVHGSGTNLLDAGGHAEVHAPEQPIAQVRVQQRLELVRDGFGRADHQLVEARLLKDGQRHFGGVTQVLVLQRVTVMGDVAALFLASRVVITRQLVEKLGVVDEIAELEHEHPSPLRVGQQHTECGRVFDDGFELTDRGHVVDDHLVLHGHGQRDHFHKSCALHAKIAKPRVRERSRPAFTKLSMR